MLLLLLFTFVLAPVRRRVRVGECRKARLEVGKEGARHWTGCGKSLLKGRREQISGCLKERKK